MKVIKSAKTALHELKIVLFKGKYTVAIESEDMVFPIAYHEFSTLEEAEKVFKADYQELIALGV